MTYWNKIYTDRRNFIAASVSEHSSNNANENFNRVYRCNQLKYQCKYQNPHVSFGNLNIKSSLMLSMLVYVINSKPIWPSCFNKLMIICCLEKNTTKCTWNTDRLLGNNSNSFIYDPVKQYQFFNCTSHLAKSSSYKPASCTNIVFSL